LLAAIGVRWQVVVEGKVVGGGGGGAVWAQRKRRRGLYRLFCRTVAHFRRLGGLDTRSGGTLVSSFLRKFTYFSRLDTDFQAFGPLAPYMVG
jgi:hypothetical protein